MLRNHCSRLLIPTLLAMSLGAQVLMMGETSEGFVSLFNGRDLGKWEGNPEVWKVDGGVIVVSMTEATLASTSALFVMGPSEWIIVGPDRLSSVNRPSPAPADFRTGHATVRTGEAFDAVTRAALECNVVPWACGSTVSIDVSREEQSSV